MSPKKDGRFVEEASSARLMVSRKRTDSSSSSRLQSRSRDMIANRAQRPTAELRQRERLCQNSCPRSVCHDRGSGRRRRRRRWARKVVVRCGEKLIGAALEVLHRARQVGSESSSPMSRFHLTCRSGDRPVQLSSTLLLITVICFSIVPTSITRHIQRSLAVPNAAKM